jgi:hypothetical protein
MVGFLNFLSIVNDNSLVNLCYIIGKRGKNAQFEVAECHIVLVLCTKHILL